MTRRATSTFVFDSRTDIPIDATNDELIERVEIAKTFTARR